jgi:hypothetical protein
MGAARRLVDRNAMGVVVRVRGVVVRVRRPEGILTGHHYPPRLSCLATRWVCDSQQKVAG